MSAPSPFNKEQVYDNEISPLMAQIIEICKRENIPMVASFCYALGLGEDDHEGVSYCTTNLPFIDPKGNWQTPEYLKAIAIIRRGVDERPKMIAMTVTRTEDRDQ